MNIGVVLRAWRCHEEMSLREASERLGISLATLDRIERGGDMSGENMGKIFTWLLKSSQL
jgi:cytoskeletal protein RodZ